jgi:hypothetical protein
MVAKNQLIQLPPRTNTTSRCKRRRQTLPNPLIRRCHPSGSFMKGTANKSGTDIDFFYIPVRRHYRNVEGHLQQAFQHDEVEPIPDHPPECLHQSKGERLRRSRARQASGQLRQQDSWNQRGICTGNCGSMGCCPDPPGSCAFRNPRDLPTLDGPSTCSPATKSQAGVIAITSSIHKPR